MLILVLGCIYKVNCDSVLKRLQAKMKKRFRYFFQKKNFFASFNTLDKLFYTIESLVRQPDNEHAAKRTKSGLVGITWL